MGFWAITVMDEFDPRLHFTAEETWHSPRGKAIREVVFGMHDGLITSLGFLSGMSGAQASRGFILLAGAASAFAQTLSMGFGAYLSTKSEREFYQREIDRERYEIEHLPEEEREELRVIYGQKGFREDEVEMIVKRLTSDKTLWLKTMMVEELGLIEERFDDPVKVGALIGIASFVGALLPLFPYIFLPPDQAFPVSVVTTGAALFVTGAGKTILTKKTWWKSGLEMTGIGLFVAGASYLLGRLVGVNLGG